MKPQDVYTQLQSDPNAALVDVRELNEWNSGRAEPAVHFALGGFPENFLETQPDSSITVYLICRSGGRSSIASDLLKKNGFEQVVNVDGGMIAWEKAKLPMIK